MKLALIPYINTAPYAHNLDKIWLAKQDRLDIPPRQMGLLARQGGVDAGVFSLVDSWDLVENYGFEPVGGLGIAGYGPIGSIYLFGVAGLKNLEGRDVAITPDTATTSNLLAVLANQAGVKKWQAVDLGQKAAATLLIGDAAMARRFSTAPDAATHLDLCAAWTALTKLPFVFARWCVRKAVPEADRGELRVQLELSLDRSLENLEVLTRELSRAKNYPQDYLEEYLKGIRYRLGREEEKGMNLFREKLSQEGLWPGI